MFQLQLQVQTIHPEKGVTSSRAWTSKSFVKNFLHLLFGNLITNTTVDPIDTGGTPRNNASSYQTSNLLKCPQVFGGSRVYTYDDYRENFGEDVGIQVGDGVAANTALTYTLHQKIDHGVGTGELEYSGGFFGEPTIDGADTYFDIERIFRNASGGSIVIKEYSIVVLWGDMSGNSYPILIVRDVFTEEIDWVTVANSEYLKITYRLLVTV